MPLAPCHLMASCSNQRHCTEPGRESWCALRTRDPNCPRSGFATGSRSVLFTGHKAKSDSRAEVGEPYAYIEPRPLVASGKKVYGRLRETPETRDVYSTRRLHFVYRVWLPRALHTPVCHSRRFLISCSCICG